MKNHHFSLFLALIIIATPAVSNAEYGFEHYWNDEPAIIPSGPPVIIFPVQGGARFTDDFSDPRSGGRQHEGNDLLAPKMSLIIAAQAGKVTFAPTTQPSWGYEITIAGDDGYIYNYLHINNDTPGTDDGLGGPQNAYAPGIQDGIRVTQGQHIAWVGDSGNAEAVAPHLHFEIRQYDDTAINPFAYLNAALKIFAFDIATVKTVSPTIDADKGLVSSPDTAMYCVAGSLVRTSASPSVYYCGSDGKRYVFPNAQTYATWYDGFSTVKTITGDELANIRLGGNVTYRPGVKLVKIQTEPKVYAVDKNGTLRWVASPEVATKYYGASWAKKVEDIPDTFFTNYTIGQPITN